MVFPQLPDQQKSSHCLLLRPRPCPAVPIQNIFKLLAEFIASSLWQAFRRQISYKCLDIVAGSSCGVVAVDLEQSSEDGRSCVFSGDGSNIWKDRMAKSEGKAAGSLGTTRETKRCEGERERRRECGHKWGIDWTYNNQIAEAGMFSFEDIYGYDAANYGQNYTQESVYQYFPLFHHSADEYSPELFRPKEQIEDSLPTDARIDPPQHLQPQTADSEPVSIGEDWSQARSAESIQYPDLVLWRAERSRRGGRFETNNIGKHLKSLTLRLLFALEDARILGSSEQAAVRQFRARNGSKRDFQELLRHRSLREKFVEFCSTKNFVKEILSSAKMSFRSKVMMVKHLERLRAVGCDGSPNWKD